MQSMEPAPELQRLHDSSEASMHTSQLQGEDSVWSTVSLRPRVSVDAVPDSARRRAHDKCVVFSPRTAPHSLICSATSLCAHVPSDEEYVTHLGWLLAQSPVAASGEQRGGGRRV